MEGEKKNCPRATFWCLFVVSEWSTSMQNTSWGHNGRNYLNHNPQLTAFVCLLIVDVQSVFVLGLNVTVWAGKWVLILLNRTGNCLLGSWMDSVDCSSSRMCYFSDVCGPKWPDMKNIWWLAGNQRSKWECVVITGNISQTEVTDMRRKRVL